MKCTLADGTRNLYEDQVVPTLLVGFKGKYCFILDLLLNGIIGSSKLTSLFML